MKKNTGRFAGILSGALAVAMMFTGCGGAPAEKTNDQPSSSKSSGETVSEKPVELNWMYFDNGGMTGKYEQVKDSPVIKALESKLNVKITMTGVDADKKKVIMAGGDTTDLLNIKLQSDILPMLKGGLLMPLDDLINKKGENIKTIKPEVLQMAQTALSDGSGKAYVLPVNAGNEGHTNVVYHSIYMLRWDYYKEMGYPQVKNPEDMLNVLKKMQEAHPKTEDGKPVYGASFYTDSILGVFPHTFGYKPIGSIFIRVSDNEMIYRYTDEESLFWMATEYWNKAYRMGILDPDSLTQKVADFDAKANSGQLLSPWWYNKGTAFVDAALKKDPNSIVGFETIPVEGTTIWANTIAPAGWQSYFNAIPTTCKNPEKAMEVLNYLYGYEGSRLMKSGVEGVHWEMVGGKPEMTDEAIKLRIAGGDQWTATGIGSFNSITGIGDFEIGPDGGPMLLSGTEKFFVQMSKPVDKDYSAYYGSAYPFGVFEKFIAEGKISDHSKFDGRLLVTGNSDDDITRIDAKLKDIEDKAIPQLVLAKSESEFAKVKAETIAKYKAANAAASKDWWQKRYAEVRKTYGH